MGLYGSSKYSDKEVLIFRKEVEAVWCGVALCWLSVADIYAAPVG